MAGTECMLLLLRTAVAVRILRKGLLEVRVPELFKVGSRRA